MTNEKKTYFFLIVTFYLLILSYDSESNTFDNLHISLDDPMLCHVYDFIDHMLLKHNIFPFHPNIRPYTYRQLKQLLTEFQKRNLSTTDRKQLLLYLNYFGEPESLVEYEIERARFRLNLELGSHVTLRNEANKQLESEYAWQIRPILTGQLAKDLYFSTDLRFFLITGQNLPNTIRTEVEVDQRNEKAFDTGGLIPAYLQFQFPWFDLLIGKQNLSWGPGRNGNLILSAYAMPMEMIYLKGIYEKAAFQAFHGVAQDPKGNKIVSGHRIDICPFPWINLGISEILVINSTYFDFRFLNPVTVYAVSEVSGEGFFQFANGDNYSRGNLLISGDILIKPIKNVETYLEIMIDDFQPRYGWKSYLHWASKWGVLAGVKMVNPFSLRNTYFLLEYAFLNQYVYTHAKPLNTYSHLQRPIGHRIGPDSQSVSFHLKHRLTSKFLIANLIEFERYGEQKITEPRSPSDEEDGFWEYLSGIDEKLFSAGFLVQFNSPGKWMFKTEYKWTRILNYQNEKENNIISKAVQIICLYRF